MRCEDSRRIDSRFRAGAAVGLAMCTIIGALWADNRAVAQASRPPSGQSPMPRLELGRAATLERVAYAVEGAESDHGTDPHMWGPDPGGPQGPMQVSAAAAEDVGGGDRFDERENRVLGRAYLAQLYRRYGNWPDAVAAYNWGPGNMDAWIGGGRPIVDFPIEVERYRDRVLRDAGFDATSRNPLFYVTGEFPEIPSPQARRSPTVVTSVRPAENRAAAGPSPLPPPPHRTGAEGQRQLIRP